MEREGIHPHHQRTLAVIFRYCCLAVLLHLWLWCKLWQLCQLFQYGDEIRVGEVILCQQVPQVLYGKRYAFYEVCLAFKIPSESVCSQYLHGAEKNKQLQPLAEGSE